MYYSNPRKPHKRLSLEEIEQIQILCQEHALSYPEIAKLYDTSANTIRNYCLKIGMVRQTGRKSDRLERQWGQPLSDTDKERIKALCQYQFLNYSEVANLFKVSISTIYLICQEEGFSKPRGRVPGREMPTYQREIARLNQTNILIIQNLYEEYIEQLAKRFEISSRAVKEIIAELQ